MNFNFGALFPGDGTAWFDGQGYQVQPDTEVFHSGKQSLRMSHAPDSAEAVAPEEASAAWQAVVRYMEESRAAYSAIGWWCSVSPSTAVRSRRLEYRAVTKSLRDWTVGVAPEGTLDATLASAEIPVFALDLRNASAWFNESHRARMIGAVYSEDNQQNYWNDMVVTKVYDALLFVDNTTPARKIPR